jgi:type II secretory pathway component PulK
MKSHSCNAFSLPLTAHGGVSVRIVMAIATLVVVGVAIVFLLQTQQKNLQVHQRKALEISEYGLLQALQRLRQDPDWRAGLEKTAYNEGWYAVRIEPLRSHDGQRLRVISEGHSGAVSQEKIMVLAKEPLDGDSVWIRQEIH